MGAQKIIKRSLILSPSTTAEENQEIFSNWLVNTYPDLKINNDAILNLEMKRGKIIKYEKRD